MAKEEMILVLDFGSQYTQLIARRVRELNVYCEIHPYNDLPEVDDRVKGVILSGSPFSVHDKEAPIPELSLFRGKLPLLGLCYGAQLLAHLSGGRVVRSSTREYGRAEMQILNQGQPLFVGLTERSNVWMSHADTIDQLPASFETIACTEEVAIAGYQVKGETTYGLQFHPEVYHTELGKEMMRNFVLEICGCSGSWTPASYIEETVAAIQQKVGNDEVVLGLSGGVDSTVAAVLMDRAIGSRLQCLFVNNGVLRKGEFEQVLEGYREMGLNVKGIDASHRFYVALSGITDPEKKRKAIGNLFINVFEEEAKKLSNVRWLAQGTIYPDVIESVSVKGPSQTIKSHHNVGGLPEKMHLKVIEPLRALFKDEVRKVGKALHIPEEILNRHPFPGPGLAIRIIGEVTQEKVKLLQEADAVFMDQLKKENLYSKIWQAGTMLLPVQTVGVMGDERTYENTIALRAVTSTDGMTADWYPFAPDFLARTSNLIINKIKGVNRVVYDISSKPPATIEWE